MWKKGETIDIKIKLVYIHIMEDFFVIEGENDGKIYITYLFNTVEVQEYYESFAQDTNNILQQFLFEIIIILCFKILY